MEGYLEKLKRNNTSILSSLSSWNTRYFWLDPRSCQLLYYKNKRTSKSRSPKGGFRLEDIVYICFDDEQYNFKTSKRKKQNHLLEKINKQGKKKTKIGKKSNIYKNNYQFSIQTRERYFILRAKTHGEFRKWTRVLSKWLKTHMDRIAEAEQQRLIDNGLSLYPREMPIRTLTSSVNNSNSHEKSNIISKNTSIIKNPNMEQSTLSESTISHSPNSDLSNTSMNDDNNTNNMHFTSPTNTNVTTNSSKSTTSSSSSSSSSGGGDYDNGMVDYNDNDLNTVQHCLDLDDDYMVLKLDYGEKAEVEEEQEQDDIEEEQGIHDNTTTTYEGKMTDTNEEEDMQHELLNKDLEHLKLQSEMCLKQLQLEIDKKTKDVIQSSEQQQHQQKEEPPPPPPPKRNGRRRRSLARKTLLNMKTNKSPNTMAKLVNNVAIENGKRKKHISLHIETKYNNDNDDRVDIDEKGDNNVVNVDCTTPVHALTRDNDSGDDSSSSDGEDSFIVAKTKQEQLKRLGMSSSASWNDDVNPNDENRSNTIDDESKFDIGMMDHSELILSDEEEEEQTTNNTNGIWLVDRNSWDDDDDDVVDQSIHMGNDGNGNGKKLIVSKHESKCNEDEEKDEEHVDMNTWDSSSSDDEEAEEEDDDDDGTDMI